MPKSASLKDATPLFELVNGGVTGNVIGSSFGAIFVIILTMYLLNKQTEIEQESKKGEKVFEEKVLIYKSIIENYIYTIQLIFKYLTN